LKLINYITMSVLKSIYIPEDLLKKVQGEAKIQNRSASNLIVRIIEEHYSVLELRKKEQK